MLQERLAGAMTSAITWHGVFYRATDVPYATSAELLTGEGARRHGGRWTPPARFAAVYGSLEPETAMEESLAHHRHYGLPVSEAMPLVFVAVRVTWQAMFDLSRANAAQTLGLNVRALLDEDWRASQQRGAESLAQAVGRVAWELGFGGLLVPSAHRPGAANVVLFPSRRRKGDSLRIQRVRDLPK